MNKLVLFFLCLLPLNVFAQSSAEGRETRNSTALVGYELFSSWIPSKFVGSYTYNFNRQWSLEAEYARGYIGSGVVGIDVASISENRYSLQARRFFGNSFHTIFGLYKDDFIAHLGSEILDDMTNTSIDEVRVEVIGVSLGIGNRWQWNNGFTLGVDWFRMGLPILDKKIEDDVLDNITNDDDEDTIENAIDKITNVPTFVVFGFYLGYSF